VHKHLRGLAALGAAATIAVPGVVVGLSTPASAVGQQPDAGTAMTLTPASGNNFVIPGFATSSGCPAEATHTYVQLFGGQLPDDGAVIKDTARDASTSAFAVEATRRFQDAFEAAGQTSIAPGTYRSELVCTDGSLAQLKRFTADLRFTSATAYTTSAEPTPGSGVRGIANACPPESTPQASFTDVPRSAFFATAVDCIVSWRVTTGKTATTYAPSEFVSRAQMAQFIARVIANSGGTLPSDPADAFTDDEDLSPANELAINQLAALGVVAGTGPGSYSPSRDVTRAQMAKFLVEGYQARTDKTLTASRDYFTDDEAFGGLEDFINRSAEAGFAAGTGGTSYSPGAQVTRAQMALFLARVLDKLAAEDGAVRPA
jgi:hypothetical protein